MGDAAATEAPAVEGWAIVEVMGHRKLAGYVRAQAFGSTVMLRVDTPDLPARKERDWDGEFEHPAESGSTRYVGMGSIYQLTLCSEDVAKAAADRIRVLPPRRLQVERKQLPGDDGQALASDQESTERHGVDADSVGAVENQDRDVIF